LDNKKIKDVMQSAEMYFPLDFKFKTIEQETPSLRFKKEVDRLMIAHEYNMKNVINPEILSDRKFAQTLKKTSELARVKNAFFVYKRCPNNRVADFIIARDD
jgi:hypothetical protein